MLRSAQVGAGVVAGGLASVPCRRSASTAPSTAPSPRRACRGRR